MKPYQILIVVVLIVVLFIILNNKAKAATIIRSGTNGTNGTNATNGIGTSTGNSQKDVCDLMGYFIQENGKIYKIWKDIGKVKKLEVTFYNQGYNVVDGNVTELTQTDYDNLKLNAYIPPYQWYKDDVKSYCP